MYPTFFHLYIDDVFATTSNKAHTNADDTILHSSLTHLIEYQVMKEIIQMVVYLLYKI